MNEQHKQIVNDYVNNFLSNSEISTKYNVHRGSVQRILLRYNVELRKRTPGIKVNHFFFSEYNSDSCYWAGFLLADGYIRTNKRFGIELKLKPSDYGHLVKFKEALEYEGKIADRIDYVNLSISSSQLINDLKNNFGVVTQKTFTATIIDKIPELYLRDFIRGYFDGDGCISNNIFSVIGTYSTINSIRDYFYKNGVRLKSKEQPDISKSGNVYCISYSGKAAFKTTDLMYNNSSVYLDRKFKLYNNLKLKYDE